jgi:hypothetical protein
MVFKQLKQATAAPPAVERGHFVRCRPVAELEGSVLRRSSIGSTDDARRPLLLYQASIRLLASRSIREVIESTLELAAHHSGAASVGWFRVTEESRLEPVCVVPPGSGLATLVGESTTRLVVREGNAIWLASSGPADAAAHEAEPEIACLPIVERERVHAALVASAASGSMRSADFDFLVALASLASAACAGHATGTSKDGGADLASLLTVDLAAGDDDDDAEGLRQGTLALDEARLRELVLSTPDPSPAMARINSFVAETGTLRLDEWQRVLVIEALRRTGGSVPNAAVELGISRGTLCKALDHYGLTRHG